MNAPVDDAGQRGAGNMAASDRSIFSFTFAVQFAGMGQEEAAPAPPGPPGPGLAPPPGPPGPPGANAGGAPLPPKRNKNKPEGTPAP